jgi:hypothetical protein
VDLEQIVCPRFPEHRRGGRRIGPLAVELPTTETPDFLWTWQSDCLIRSEVIELLHGDGLGGWQVKRAQAEAPGGAPVAAEYWELVVTGWGGVAPPESGIRLVERCDYCGFERYTCFSRAPALVDPSHWDGSDFFIVWPLPRFVFLAERAASLIRAHAFSGIRLVPLTDLRCDGVGVNPGRLEWFMPDERARELRALLPKRLSVA